jgi:phage terminase large subunit GpA-like protein
MQILDRVERQAVHVFRPPPKLTVSQWADAYRRLSPEASAEPGKWDTQRAPYQRGIMDAVCNPDVEMVVVMSSAQVGKTEVVLNITGYHVDQDPSPMLILQPTLEMAEAFSKDRLAPMVRDTPALRGKIKDPRARDSGNTLLHKRFPGGHVTMAGANSPASLASRPIRVVLCDEVDRYPPSAAAEGDPVNLAKKRTATFWNRVVVLTSTPTIKGLSRIETAYEQSDQRKYHVPCPHCDTHQELLWHMVRWDEDDPSSAQIACEHCGALWTNAERIAAIRAGRWVATADFDGTAGFHLSELYSPWSTPAQMAKAFVDAKRAGTEQLKTWVNTSLGQSWEERGETVDPESLMGRRETFPDHIPHGAAVLTIGADVQSDRIELELVAWSADEESWSIDYEILPGDPTQDDVWRDLEASISAKYIGTGGKALSVSQVCVDAGYLTKRVQTFAERMGQHVVPVIGRAGPNRPIVETSLQRIKRLRKRRTTGVKAELVGVDEAKAMIYRRLPLLPGGAGTCHFPDDRDTEYFDQLTAEKLVTKYSKGRPIREWVKTRERNEALDCRVYAYAAFLLIKNRLPRSIPDKTVEEKLTEKTTARSQWKQRRMLIR